VNLVYKFNYYFKKESISYTSLFSSGAGNADFSLRWQKRGDEKITTVPSMIYPANNNRDAFYNSSDVLVRKGDHIRLQFINLSYDAVSAGGKTSLVKQLQFYTNLANLPVIWKANRDRIDPDYGTEIPPGISATIGIRASF
jgi:hypothetical protein